MSSERPSRSDAAHEVPPAELISAIRAAARIALIGHVTPDADCLGSMGALWTALPELGKHAFAALPAGSVSRRLNCLLDECGMAPAAMTDLKTCDLAIVVDTAKDRRVNLEGKLDALPGTPILNIDHHATNPGYGRWNWIVPHASSSAELVYRVLRALECTVTPTVATLLYAGVHSDTRGFSLPNTTPESLEVGHDLARAGARVCEICEKLSRSFSPGEFQLSTIVYANTRVSPDGKLAWSSVPHAEFAATGCAASDIDDQVDIPRSIEGIHVAILFSEGNPGKIRMNFRGERGVSVLPLAQQFGGGGHHGAAGAILDGPLENVRERVLAAAIPYAVDPPRAGAAE